MKLIPIQTRPGINWVGLDFETTGFNTYINLANDIELSDGTKYLKGQRVHGAIFNDILSIGLIVLDERGEIKTRFHGGIRVTDDTLKKMDPTALSMHTNSGLLDRLKTGEGFDVMTENAEEMSRICVDFLKENGCTQYERSRKKDTESGTVLFGNTIGFDLSFADAQMPALYKFASYRTLDISSINLFAKMPQIKTLNLHTVKKLYCHTALEDIQETHAELACYRGQLLDLVVQDLNSVPVQLNQFNENGNPLGSSTKEMSVAQISDVIDHAAQLVLMLENSTSKLSKEDNVILGELQAALQAAYS